MNATSYLRASLAFVLFFTCGIANAQRSLPPMAIEQLTLLRSGVANDEKNDECERRSQTFNRAHGTPVGSCLRWALRPRQIAVFVLFAQLA